MLETIWFVLWGVLWAVYFMLDGFDLGIGMLMPFLARNDEEKRTMTAYGDPSVLIKSAQAKVRAFLNRGEY